MPHYSIMLNFQVMLYPKRVNWLSQTDKAVPLTVYI